MSAITSGCGVSRLDSAATILTGTISKMTWFKAADAVGGLVVVAAIVTLTIPFYVAMAMVLFNKWSPGSSSSSARAEASIMASSP